MLHLAKVQKNGSQTAQLQLLAKQTSEGIWVAEEKASIEILKETDNLLLQEGLLVLVELGVDNTVVSVTDVNHWIVEILIEKLPLLAKEEAKVEQWRRELTLKSQEISIKNLEVETRQEQLQDLEESLKREKQELEQRWEELKNKEKELAVDS